MGNTLLQKPNLIVRNGKPEAVILALKEYERLLEMAQGRGDLNELKKIKRSKTSFRSIEEYVAGRL